VGGLLSFIPHGRAQATNIRALIDATGLPDREVRSEIKRLVREQHIPIVCLPTSPGVFIAETEAEVEAGQRQMRSRAMSLLTTARALRLCGESLVWSPTLFDVTEV
jgi:hypothetical protein